jgi:hypothetical protein
LFDQKEPYVEISYKHQIAGGGVGGLVQSKGFMDSTSKDFLSAMSVMQDEQRMQFALGKPH